jgi:hypothetical protein
MRLSLPDLAAAYMAARMAKTRRACGTFAAISNILLLVYRLRHAAISERTPSKGRHWLRQGRRDLALHARGWDHLRAGRARRNRGRAQAVAARTEPMTVHRAA